MVEMPKNGSDVFRGKCEQMRRHRDGRRVASVGDTPGDARRRGVRLALFG